MPSTLPSPIAFQDWLRTRPGFERARVTAVAHADGGASNLTCRVDLRNAPYAAVCLRVQRERGIFEPYDVIREGRVISALGSTSVPAPAFLGAESDAGVLGAPFIVLEWIDAPHMGIAGAEADFGAFTATVTNIHAVDWRTAGLAFLAATASIREAIQSELEIISARMPAFGCAKDPLLRRAFDILHRAAPSDGSMSLCQGDINVFNYLFRAKKCVGVVDWEQARISDRRCDVGHLLALVHLKGAPFGPVREMGFLNAYEAISRVHLAGMEYFRARWLFELAVIYHGWMSFNDSEPWYSRVHVEALLTLALAEIE